MHAGEYTSALSVVVAAAETVDVLGVFLNAVAVLVVDADATVTVSVVVAASITLIVSVIVAAVLVFVVTVTVTEFVVVAAPPFSVVVAPAATSPSYNRL